MKLLISTFAAATLLATPALSAHYNLDPTTSKLTWLGKKKITGDEHNGTINLSSGALTIENNKVVSGEIFIDMSSIVNLDVTNEKYKKKLEGHLKSDDFFASDKFNFASFKFTNGGSKQVVGQLQIRDKVQTQTIPFTLTKAGDTYSIKGNLTFDRSQFDVKYNSETFFSLKKLGDKVIDNQISLSFDLKTSPSKVRVVRVPNILKDGKKTWLPTNIKTAQGETVTLELVNTLDAPHGFQIDDLKITKVVPANSSTTVTFKTETVGTMNYKCQLHPAHVGGKIIVERSTKT